MSILIKNGRVVDPANGVDTIQDILIKDKKIAKVSRNIKDSAGEIIDASGKIVMPGIIDMHVHLREPGREDKETVASGTRAALKGGVTSLLAMPNTCPAIDSVENIRMLKAILQKTAVANVLVSGAVTKERKGEELADIAGLKKQGAVALSDDGSSVESASLFLRAMKKAKENKLLVICHCEDKALSGQGVINLGFTSTRLGLKGIPGEAEYQRVERDIRLAGKAGAPVHIAHVSCRESVKIIAAAKKKGLKVTAETAPHYFALTEEAVSGYDTNLKMNPPLRSRDDLEAIRQGLKSGAIDAIASDHAPHTENEKDIEFDRAEFGVVGLETELAVSITELIRTGLLTWPELVMKLAVNPGRILGIDRGNLAAGSIADLIVISPDREWVVEKAELVSQSKNSAFLGKKLYGAVDCTILEGKIVYRPPDHRA